MMADKITRRVGTRMVRRDGYTLVYKQIENPDPESYRLVSWLDGYELHDGYFLFEVCATYAKSLDPARYYVVARSNRLAREKFLDMFPWLNCIKSISQADAELAEQILSCKLLRTVL